jgi:hypothetical protein
MATSGTYDFTMTASQFLDSVLRLSGVLGEGETALAAQFDIAMESLNLQLHQLDVNDVPVWKRDFYDFKPVDSSYVTNGGSAYRCVKGHTSAADTEPGVGDLWQGYWVLDIDPVGSPGAWALTTAYVTSIEFEVPAKFYDILSCTTLQNSSNEIAIDIASFDYYTNSVNSKRTSLVSTVPILVAFDNKIPNTGHIYPQPTNTFNSTMRIYGIVKPEDVDATNQNMDIPPRYLNMLRFNVALDIAYTYNNDAESIQLLMRQAQYYLDQYRKSNREFTSSNFTKGAY